DKIHKLNYSAGPDIEKFTDFINTMASPKKMLIAKWGINRIAKVIEEHKDVFNIATAKPNEGVKVAKKGNSGFAGLVGFGLGFVGALGALVEVDG
ncbi:unnamed protein product, partial [marine sediment metagenome]